MKAIEQYFPVVLIVMLYKVVLTFNSSLRPTTAYILCCAIERKGLFLIIGQLFRAKAVLGVLIRFFFSH